MRRRVRSAAPRLPAVAPTATSRDPACGSVPIELGSMQELQVLYLKENTLGGALPDGLFTNMTELRYIMMQENQLTGGVPTEVFPPPFRTPRCVTTTRRHSPFLLTVHCPPHRPALRRVHPARTRHARRWAS